MKKFIAILASVTVIGAAVIWMRTQPQDVSSVQADINIPSLNETQSLGKIAFDVKCASCHGENALGKDGAGPPLVHKIYEPGHHGDYAFRVAVANGVRSHHWPFGNMPPIDDLTQGDVKNIVSYVRALQRANGIH